MEESTAENIESNTNTNSTSTNTANKRRRLNHDQSGNDHPQRQHANRDSNDTSKERNSQEPQSPLSVFNGKDPYDFTAKELKELCRTKGLKVGGNKSDLITRLLDPTSSVNRKGSKRTTKKQVHTMLRNAGIEDPEKVNKCLKKGIQKGYFAIDGPGSLDEVILLGKCSNRDCKRDLVVTIRDVLYQSSNGIYYIDRDNEGAVHCGSENENCYRKYVTALCEGEPRLDSGKFHNHCEECPGFGKCIGDWREAHCASCGKHWFAGTGNQFPCPCGSYAPDVCGYREFVMNDTEFNDMDMPGIGGRFGGVSYAFYEPLITEPLLTRPPIE